MKAGAQITDRRIRTCMDMFRSSDARDQKMQSQAQTQLKGVTCFSETPAPGVEVCVPRVRHPQQCKSRCTRLSGKPSSLKMYSRMQNLCISGRRGSATTNPGPNDCRPNHHSPSRHCSRRNEMYQWMHWKKPPPSSLPLHRGNILCIYGRCWS